MVQWADEDAGGQADPVGASSEKRKEVERIGQLAIDGQHPATALGIRVVVSEAGRHHHVLDHRDRIEPRRLGVPDEVRHPLRVRRDVGAVGRRDSELHG